MSTEINVAATKFLDDPWTILDCPGSVELGFEAQCALLAADVAVVVCEPIVDKALTLSPLLKFLDDRNIPHMLFINRLDTAEARVSEVLAALQGGLGAPPGAAPDAIPGKEGTIDGYVDLVSERAYKYKPGQASDSGQASRRRAGRTSRPGAAVWSRSWPISTTSCWNSSWRMCSPRKRTSTSI